MKMMRSSILCLAALLLLAPLLRAQDLSKYRHFTLGMSLTRVLNRTERRMTDVNVIHSRPALIQELTWWPPNLPGASFQADTVEQMLFSFQNGELYKMSVTYDRTSTEGLTPEDMVKSISADTGRPQMLCWRSIPRRLTLMTRSKSSLRRGKIHNIPSILCDLLSVMFWGWSFIRSERMEKLNLPLRKL